MALTEQADLVDWPAGTGLQTIADFRKDNGSAITACSRFVSLCRNMKVFYRNRRDRWQQQLKAVNSRDRNFHRWQDRRRQATGG